MPSIMDIYNDAINAGADVLQGTNARLAGLFQSIAGSSTNKPAAVLLPVRPQSLGSPPTPVQQHIPVGARVTAQGTIYYPSATSGLGVITDVPQTVDMAGTGELQPFSVTGNMRDALYGVDEGLKKLAGRIVFQKPSPPPSIKAMPLTAQELSMFNATRPPGDTATVTDTLIKLVKSTGDRYVQMLNQPMPQAPLYPPVQMMPSPSFVPNPVLPTWLVGDSQFRTQNGVPPYQSMYSPVVVPQGPAAKPPQQASMAIVVIIAGLIVAFTSRSKNPPRRKK